MVSFALAIVAFVCSVGTLGFYRPDRVFKRAAIAVVCAILLPYVAAHTLGPFLGEGAGMGVAFILYASSALLLVTALAASLGAGVRQAWVALRG